MRYKAQLSHGVSLHSDKFRYGVARGVVWSRDEAGMGSALSLALAKTYPD